ncbi:YhcN/YlaJ family sporulation lipoprotein [Bacillus sp. CGMCC 1.16541]|uniref:YhcN/YlaJ family sporulation lipoprotein n=1 Tax=Bacillus sp. CGMCC 1.16541 TaxID=2185143 RepID=UPI000D72963D|nr:YhcN/YlaJ family sporulation lipoprotein [Bacillus sp. CGMCC 1.16541]
MIRVIPTIFVGSLAVLSLVGCASNQQGKNELMGQDDARNVVYENVNNTNDTTQNNQETRIRVANEAGDRVVKLEEVRQANIIVTDNNAYVGAVLENNTEGELTKEIERKISDEVKAADPDINNVYVSTNPDFVDRMGNYVNKIESGRPLTGLLDEFNEVVRRVFPNAR